MTLESVDGTFTAKMHSIMKSQEGVTAIELVEPSYGFLDVL